jgi:hypothetical protein
LLEDVSLGKWRGLSDIIAGGSGDEGDGEGDSMKKGDFKGHHVWSIYTKWVGGARRLVVSIVCVN